MLQFSIQLPFHLLPELVLITALIMMIRHRTEIGNRRFRFGMAGLSMILVLRIVSFLISVLEVSRRIGDIDSVIYFQTYYGLANSALHALALWFVFIAITNRRKVPNEQAP